MYNIKNRSWVFTESPPKKPYILYGINEQKVMGVGCTIFRGFCVI